MNYLNRAKNFRAKKRLGQNFLIDENAINTIIENANLSKDENVLEIGPGLGFVTEQLAAYTNKVFAVEIDTAAIYQIAALPFENIEIIKQDILKTNLNDYLDQPTKIIANIPYYITGPIIGHLLGEIGDIDFENRKYVKEIIFMVQYEVGKRIVANSNSPAKDYGLLSILCNYWCETELLAKVPSKSFFPAPKVNSAIVKLTIRKEPLVQLNNSTLFRTVIKSAFSTRRKTIKNTLSKDFDKEMVIKALELSNIDSIRRAETISIEEFKTLTDTMEKLLND